MYSSAKDFRELDALLERWCENRLSGSDVARLEQLVLADGRAMQRYLSYVQLHGMLAWDKAICGEPEVKSPGRVNGHAPRPVNGVAPRLHLPFSRPVRPHSRPRIRSTTMRWITLAAASALLITVVAELWVASSPEPPREPIAEQPRATTPVTVPPALSEAGQPDEKTIVPIELEPRPPRTETRWKPIAGTPAADPPPVEPPDAGTPTDTPPGVGTLAFVDQQLAAGWKAAELTPSPDAEDGEWLRRAALDLSGRIPSLPVLNAFLEDDSPDKRAAFVGRMLSEDHFAQHFSRVWATQLVGRSADTADERHGLQRFLVAQFSANRPWNETIAELIAAEGSVQNNGAAGFLLANLDNAAVPATAVTARFFLGQQVQCTQCHKHPWNEWSQETFWKLNAFFQQARVRQRGGLPVLVDESVGGATYYESLRGVMQVTYPEYNGKPVDPGEEVVRRQELADLVSRGEDLQLARAFVNRTWGHFFGYGFTMPVDDMGPHNPPSLPELLERLARDFKNSGYDVHQLVRWITGSQAYRLSSRFGRHNTTDDPAAGNPPLFSRMPVKSITPQQVYDSLCVASLGEAYTLEEALNRRNEREAWVRQFIDVLENEENSELSNFGGSLTQALTMMNGRLMAAALSGEPGTVLHHICTARVSDEERIRLLCRAALSRDPTEAEWLHFRRQLAQAKSARLPDRRAEINEVLRDIYWAYLNSTEFLTNR
jgi:hypothetical protein